MKFKLIVKEEAEQDMTESFEYYEEQQSGLGAEFLDEVESYFNQLINYPEHYQKNEEIRTAVLHRFPHKIIYEVEKEFVVVYAVFHSKRNPNELIKRF